MIPNQPLGKSSAGLRSKKSNGRGGAGGRPGAFRIRRIVGLYASASAGGAARLSIAVHEDCKT
jgi:hypothetical protein